MSTGGRSPAGARRSSTSLDALTRLATGAAYAGREPDADDAEVAGRASDAVVRAMRRDASLAQRITGPYRRR